MSGDTIKFFMWPWQRLFQSSAAEHAQQLLDPLDPRLKPDAFLVGFLVEEAENSYSVCVAPDDCRFQPQIFEEIESVAARLASEDPDSKIRFSAPSPAEEGIDLAYMRAVSRGIEEICTSIEPRSMFFASHPTLVKHYRVIVVVKLDREHFDSHYRLSKNFIQKEQIRYKIGRSFIETTVEAYLKALAVKLTQPEPGKDLWLIKDRFSIYREASAKLLRGPAWAGGDLMGLGAIYDICNEISLKNYEGKSGHGRLVFVREGHPNITVKLKLQNPVSVRHIGAVRKLLQMGSEQLCLFCNSNVVYGLGTIQEYDEATEDLFEIKFIKRFVWEMWHAEHRMLHSKDGMPSLEPAAAPVALIRETLVSVFPGMSIDHLVSIARTVAEQEHGAMLVITASAKTEAKRLSKQAIVIEAFELSPEMISQVTCIDGAVLVDLEGMCHAVGVILDGVANDKCTSTRGARYNSGVRYAYQEDKTARVVIVKSEDGMVDVLPGVSGDRVAS